MPALSITTISTQAACALYSGEGHFYVKCCQNEASACTCATSVYFGDRLSAGQLLEAKRKDDTYAKTLASIKRSGQKQPVQVCRNGCCLSNGHHRLAALVELGVADLIIKHSGYCFQPSRFGYAQAA